MVSESFVLTLLAFPETFGLVFLKQKAQHLRKSTNAQIKRSPPCVPDSSPTSLGR